MERTITTSFGPLPVLLARPLMFATEPTKIRARGRMVEVGFSFDSTDDRQNRWRLREDDWFVNPVRGPLGPEFQLAIKEQVSGEILAWLNQHSETVYEWQRDELIDATKDFRRTVQTAVEMLDYDILYDLKEQIAWEARTPTGEPRENRSPRMELMLRLDMALQTLDEIAKLAPVSDQNASSCIRIPEVA